MAICRIGLTGGIGSGKSTIANLWAELGAHLIDTDALARALTAPGGAAVPSLREAFGPDIVDAAGALDRERMRALAFSDPSIKSRLEGILHPLIGAEAQRLAAEAGSQAIVFDVPLLSATSTWRARCDRIVVVDCSERTQVERVMQRSGWDAAQVRRVIAQQISRALRLSIADAVVDNDGPRALSELHAEARALWSLWFPEGVAVKQ